MKYEDSPMLGDSEPFCDRLAHDGLPCNLKAGHDGACASWRETLDEVRRLWNEGRCKAITPGGHACDRDDGHDGEHEGAFCDRCGRLVTRCDGHEVEDLTAENAKLRAALAERECEAMRAVVDAARAYRGAIDDDQNVHSHWVTLCHAVRELDAARGVK